ncbi:hypothetical protein ACI4BE_29390, partial [Klebsiella pneumoniae]|uniref:hypothetical protein n=1 Tax=Klebsiella pneumoniae TaxID=573 RepID=UPI0038550BDD
RKLPKQEVFTKLPDGSFNPPLGSSSRLAISGARAGPNFIPTGGTSSYYVKYDYSNVGLTYTDGQGATLAFMPARYEDYGTAYG